MPLLDAALDNLADVVERDLGIRLRNLPGAGAAGRLAGGLVAFTGAKLIRGAELLADAVMLDERLGGADLVITGEGRIDKQTVFNKAPIEVAPRSSARNIPVVGIGGTLGPGANEVLAHGITLLEACAQPDAPLPTTVVAASAALANAAERAVLRWLGRS